MANAGTNDKESALVTDTLAAGSHLMLNRPYALNALDASLIQELYRHVAHLQVSRRAQQFIISGTGTRAFSAGADIKAIYHQGLAWLDGAQDRDPYHSFFAPEYGLDAALYHLAQPKTAIMDGIVMGGGYGLAAPCDVRIATENTVFAMPETGIGFFADVASVYHLKQAPGFLDRYCVVTGETITHARDLLALGVATHYVPSARCGALLEELSALEEPDHKAIQAIAGRYHVAPGGDAPLSQHLGCINDCFDTEDIQEVTARLSGYDKDFAQQASRLIESRAPLSLAVTFQHCRYAENADFDTVINREHHIAARFMREPCFYEGVRAMLIDKDKTPDWQPGCLADIDAQLLNPFFT